MDPRTHHIDSPRGEVDERWMREWIEFGMKDLGRYLERHAAFDRYCEERGR